VSYIYEKFEGQNPVY